MSVAAYAVIFPSTICCRQSGQLLIERALRTNNTDEKPCGI